MLVPDIPFQSSVKFASKVRSLPKRGAPFQPDVMFGNKAIAYLSGNLRHNRYVLIDRQRREYRLMFS